MNATVDAIGNPTPYVRIHWVHPVHGEMTYDEILHVRNGKVSTPGLGMTPPLIRGERPTDLALTEWKRKGKPPWLIAILR